MTTVTTKPIQAKNLNNAIEKRFHATAEQIHNPEKNSVDAVQERISKLYTKDNVLVKLPLNLIEVNQNIRSEMDADSEDFKTLVETIKLHGVLQPPLVTVTLDGSGEFHLVCVAGHRRILAAKSIGIQELNCMVRRFETSIVQTIASISENLSRRDLHPLDISDVFSKIEAEGYSRTQIEEIFDRNKATVLRYLKMASWPQEVKDLVRAKPEKFSKRFLLDLASRSLTTGELSQRIALQSGVSLEPQGNRVSKRNQQKKALYSFFEERSVTEKERELVLEALKILNLKF